MNKRVEGLQITDQAAEGFDQRSVARGSALIGNKLRPEQYLRDASADRS